MHNVYIKSSIYLALHFLDAVSSKVELYQNESGGIFAFICSTFCLCTLVSFCLVINSD